MSGVVGGVDVGRMVVAWWWKSFISDIERHWFAIWEGAMWHLPKSPRRDGSWKEALVTRLPQAPKSWKLRGRRDQTPAWTPTVSWLYNSPTSSYYTFTENLFTYLDAHGILVFNIILPILSFVT